MRRGTIIWITPLAVAILAATAAWWALAPHRGQTRLAGDLHLGQWSSEVAPAASPDAPVIGHVVRHTMRRGVRIGDRGVRLTCTADVPVIDGPTALAAHVNRRLADDARLQADGYWGIDLRQMWRALRTPSAVMEWTVDARYYVTLCSPGIISVLCDAHAYTGGAHGNSVLVSHNLALDGSATVRELGLYDVFGCDPETLNAWGDPLCAMVAEQLGRQRCHTPDPTPEELRSWTPAVTVDQLHTFTLSAEGITFHFEPYVMGSYAEGTFHVALPWSRVIDLLPGDGPVSGLAGKAASEAAGASP